MGQKLYTDRIGALSFSSPNILLASSILTIGGQQYVTGALSVAPSGLVAAGLYFVYAVQTAGVVSLTISQNVNSVGPTGFSSWKLVAAFYADGTASPAFGSFVTIEGTPTSGPITYTPAIAGFTGSTFSAATFTRNGDRIKGLCRMQNGTANSTTFQFGLPGTMTGAAALGASNTSVGKYNLSAVNNAADEYNLQCVASQAFLTVGEQRSNNGMGNVTTAVLAGGVAASLFFELPITGLTVTPLKDL